MKHIDWLLHTHVVQKHLKRKNQMKIFQAKKIHFFKLTLNIGY